MLLIFFNFKDFEHFIKLKNAKCLKIEQIKTFWLNNWKLDKEIDQFKKAVQERLI